MSNKDAGVTSQSVYSEAGHRMDSTCNIATSDRNESEKYQIVISDDEDSEETQRKSRAGSFYDDSGFNSSTSEDRDFNISLKQKCDYSGVKDMVGGNTTVRTYSSQNLLQKNDKLSLCSELATSDILVHNCEDLSLKVNAMNEVNSKENSDSLIIDNGEVNNMNNINISTRNHSRVKRQRTENDNSLIVHDTPVRPGIHRNRRHRSRDINNNDAGHRNVNSYLRKPPFKLQDCFQDQGLLSLAACITYTLVLMFVFCLFGGILDSVKSTIGTQNLKDIRQTIQSRHTRRPMASG